MERGFRPDRGPSGSQRLRKAETSDEFKQGTRAANMSVRIYGINDRFWLLRCSSVYSSHILERDDQPFPIAIQRPRAIEQTVCLMDD